MTWHEQNKEYNEILNQLFLDESWKKRAEAAQNLGLMRDARSVNLLCRALRSEKDKMVQNRIIEALGKIGDGRATLRITEILEEELKNDTIDKFRLIYIIESLMNIKDKRALMYIGQFLNSEDEDLQKLTEKAFDVIEPKWRDIVEKERKKSIEEIFKAKK
jgi:HEAT repeat protein